MAGIASASGQWCFETFGSQKQPNLLLGWGLCHDQRPLWLESLEHDFARILSGLSEHPRDSINMSKVFLKAQERIVFGPLFLQPCELHLTTQSYPLFTLWGTVARPFQLRFRAKAAMRRRPSKSPSSCLSSPGHHVKDSVHGQQARQKHREHQAAHDLRGARHSQISVS